MKLYESTGKLRYSENGWLVLDCDWELVRYYNFWIRKLLGIKANMPLHGAHITIVAGKYENVTKHSAWKKYQHKKVKFQYDGKVLWERDYFWLKIFCDRLVYIRKELGLSPYPRHKFHLTVGNTRYE